MTYTPLRQPRHQQLQVRGLQHRLSWWGPPSDNPIVLLHGYQDCGATWQFLVDCLPEEWSFVAPDWRGFGATEWSKDTYWWPDYFADLEVLLDRLVPGAAARVISHSMGANVSTQYAGIRTERLRWLVNLEGLGLRKGTPDMAPSRFAQWLDEVKGPWGGGGFKSVEHLAGLLVERNPKLPLDRARFVARAWTRDTDKGVEVLFDPKHRIVNPYIYRRDEAEACWARVTVPVLFLIGEESVYFRRRQSEFSDEFIRSTFRDSRVVTLPGLGHMMHHEDPAAVAAPIVEFVRDRG